jgi:hypothetical protein
MESSLETYLSVVVYVAVAVLVFVASWQFFREAAIGMFNSKTNAEIFAIGMAALAAGTAASLAAGPIFVMLAIFMSAIGTFYSRIELVFDRAGRFNVIHEKKTTGELLIGLVKIVALFIIVDTLFAVLTLMPLPNGLNWLVMLFSAGITAYGLTRDLGPFGEVFQEFARPELQISPKHRQSKSRLSWLTVIFLGAIILITIAVPLADVLLTLSAIAGYAGSIMLIVLLFCLVGRRH